MQHSGHIAQFKKEELLVEIYSKSLVRAIGIKSITHKF